MNSRRLLLLICLLISACSNAFDSKPLNIVFVCQHGYAKSLVAALHFERKAAAHGLNVHVVARGLTPAPVVAPAIISALAKDGFDVASFRPAALTEADLITADHIVSFGVDVPEANNSPIRIDDVPALSEDYDKGRDRIVEIVEAFLNERLMERHQIEID